MRPLLGKSVKFVCVIVLMVAPHCTLLKQKNLPDAGKGPAVCSSLHCGTCYLIAVLAPDCSGAPLGGERFRGPGSIPGRFWGTGVPSFRRCSAEPLHSGSVNISRCRSVIALTIAILGPWPGAPEIYKQINKQQKNTGFSRSLTDGYAMLMSPNERETAVHGCHCRMREVMSRPCVGVCVLLALIYW